MAFASFVLFVATLVLRSNSYGVINGHLAAYVFHRPAGPFMTWFLFGNLRPLPMFPVELTLYSTLVLPILWLCLPGLRFARRSVGGLRVKSGYCPTCGYDIRATPDRCPECGTVLGRSAAV